MANYKLTTHSTTGSTPELAFTATGTNTVVNSITATDSTASATAEVYIQKKDGSPIMVSSVSVTAADKPEETLARPLALQADDAIYVASTRTGSDFVVSYVEESEIPNGTALGGLSDVDTTTTVDGYVLTYSSSTSQWEPAASAGGGFGGGDLDMGGDDILDVGAIDASINVLNDVNTTTPVDESFLRWDAGQSKWIDETITGSDIDISDTVAITIEDKFDGVDTNLNSLNQIVKQQGGVTNLYQTVNDKTKGFVEVGSTSAQFGKNNTTIDLSENSPGIVDIIVQDDGGSPAPVTAMRVTNATGVADAPQVVVGGTTAASATTVLTVIGDTDITGDVSVTGTVSGISLNDLDDTSVAGPGVGDYVRFDGSAWRASGLGTFKNVAVSGQDTVIADSDTDTLTLTAGTNVTITTDATTDTITIASSGGGGAVAMDDLTDTFISSPAAGEVLRYDGSEWANDNFNIDEIGNVEITSVADGNVLVYDSGTSKWVNEAPSGGGSSSPYKLASYGGRHQHGTAQNGKAVMASGNSLGFNYYAWSQDFGTGVGGLGTVGTSTLSGNAYKFAPSLFKTPVDGDVVVRGTFLGDGDVTSGTWYVHVWKVDATTVSNLASGTYTASSTCTLVASASTTNPTSLSNILPKSYESTNGTSVSAGDFMFATVEHSATVAATEYYTINLNIDIE